MAFVQELPVQFTCFARDILHCLFFKYIMDKHLTPSGFSKVDYDETFVIESGK